MPDKSKVPPSNQEDTTGPNTQGKGGSSGGGGGGRSKHGNHKGGDNKGGLNALNRLNDGTHHTTGKSSS